MSDSYSIQLTERDEKFVFQLIKDGQFPNLSAIVRRGMELIREEKETQLTDIDALKALLDERCKGKFISNAEGRRRTEKMIKRNRAEHGLSS